MADNPPEHYQDSNSNYMVDSNSNYIVDDNSNYIVDENSNYVVSDESWNQMDPEQYQQYMEYYAYYYSQQSDQPETPHKDVKMEEEPKVQPKPQIQSNPTTIISHAPVAPIGPEFKSSIDGPVKTAHSITAVPLPEGYSAKGKQAALANVEIISSEPIIATYPLQKKGKVNKKMAVRAAGGTVWEDKSMALWDESNLDSCR